VHVVDSAEEPQQCLHLAGRGEEAHTEGELWHQELLGAAVEGHIMREEFEVVEQPVLRHIKRRRVYCKACSLAL
jgi:hypothetical protein